MVILNCALWWVPLRYTHPTNYEIGKQYLEFNEKTLTKGDVNEYSIRML